MLLTEDSKGYLQSDGFSGYDAVGKRDGIDHVGCLAHARRKFDEALKAQPVENRGGLAIEGVTLIQRIYHIEKTAREAGLGCRSNARSCATSTFARFGPSSDPGSTRSADTPRHRC